MVKRYITVAAMLMLITIYNVARAEKKDFVVEDFFGTYQAASLMRVEEYHSLRATRKAAEKKIGKEIVLSKEVASEFWGKVQNPEYRITQQTPAKDGEVYPEYFWTLFDANGDYWDQLTLIEIYFPSDNRPFQYVEVVDNDTLLLEDGGWAYTLKRIK